MPWIRIDCLPSTSADTPNISQVDHGHSFMDGDSMASRTSPAVDASSPSSSTPSKHSDRSDFGETVAFIEQAQIDKMENLQHIFKREGADQTLAEFICNSEREQYRCALRYWSEWCNGHALPKTGPSVGQFLKYLWHLYSDRRMVWSSIRLHRAAIATIVDPLTNSPLRQHPIVTRFMKALFLARLPSRKVKPIWSVITVLEMLRFLGLSQELVGLAIWVSYIWMTHIYSSQHILGAPIHFLVPSRIDLVNFHRMWFYHDGLRLNDALFPKQRSIFEKLHALQYSHPF